MKRERLSRQSWIDAGLKALVSEGPGALAAEPLARDLGTTKGSFYWHFKDVPEFQEAVARQWQSDAFAEVVNALSEEGAADERLRRFGKRTLDNRHDSAMRAWARTDKRIARLIAQVDAERLTYMANLLRQVGITNDDFARSCLAALIGLPDIGSNSEAAKGFETLIDLVLALK
jgi:AcrR family transcriptional regulator